jgi:hypothetical protein
MPHPRKNLKLTGDTHPPEIEDDFGMEEGGSAPAGAATAASQEERAVRIGRGAAGRALRVTTRGEDYVEAARAQVRSRPLTAAAAAFFAGFALAVVTRSGR